MKETYESEYEKITRYFNEKMDWLERERPLPKNVFCHNNEHDRLNKWYWDERIKLDKKYGIEINPMTRVETVKPLADFILRLTFVNGEVKFFDMKPYLNKGLFKELKENINLFNDISTSFGNVEWKNLATIRPDVLYENSYLINKVKDYEEYTTKEFVIAESEQSYE